MTASTTVTAGRSNEKGPQKRAFSEQEGVQLSRHDTSDTIEFPRPLAGNRGHIRRRPGAPERGHIRRAERDELARMRLRGEDEE